MGSLTEQEADNTTSQVNETTEEVDDEVKALGGELECELDCLLHEVAGSGKEGPDKFDERADEVGEGVDDGRHVGWFV